MTEIDWADLIDNEMTIVDMIKISMEVFEILPDLAVQIIRDAFVAELEDTGNEATFELIVSKRDKYESCACWGGIWIDEKN